VRSIHQHQRKAWPLDIFSQPTLPTNLLAISAARCRITIDVCIIVQKRHARLPRTSEAPKNVRCLSIEECRSPQLAAISSFKLLFITTEKLFF
jgi:hypothetical protein